MAIRVIPNKKWTDVDLSFLPHPITGDISKKINDEAVKGSMENLLFIDFNERLFQPNVGSNIKNILFDLITDSSAFLLKREIEITINDNEPRIQLNDVVVLPNYDQNGYSISIVYTIIGIQEISTVNFLLERTR